MKKHLLICYNFHPSGGSEEAVGYIFSKISASYRETIVYTQDSYRSKISIAELETMQPEIEVTFFSPSWLPDSFKKFFPASVYYQLWHLGLLIHLRGQQDLRARYSMCQISTWVAATQPVFSALLPLKTIWGPLGGVAKPPLGFFGEHPFKSRVYEWIRRQFIICAELNPVLRKVYQRSDLVLVAAEDAKKWIVGNGFKSECEVSVIPAITFPEQLTVDLSENFPQKAKQLKVVTAARLLPWKGIDLLLEAVARSGRRDVEFRIFGGGDDLERLEGLKGELGLGDKVAFEGKVTREEFLSQLGAADLFLFGSLHDSEGGACMEASGLGIPCVFLDFGGVRSCLDGCKKVIGISAANREEAIVKISQQILEAEIQLNSRESNIPRESLLFFENKKREMFKLYDRLNNV